MNQKTVYIWMATVCFCLESGSAGAGEDAAKDRAQKYFNAGLSLMETENFVVAAQEFESSVKLHPTKSGYFNLAACYFELHRYNDAVTTIDRLKREFGEDLNDQWKGEIAAFEEKLKNSIVPVEFKTNVDGVTITVDGKKIEDGTQNTPLLIDPGEHKVMISAENFDTISETISIKAGQGKTVFNFVMVDSKSSEKKNKGNGKQQETVVQNTTYPVHFENEEKKDKGKRRPRIGTAVAFSIGGATGLAAVTTGVIHLVGVSNIRDSDSCSYDVCEYDSGTESQLNKMKKLGVATNVLISVAAVAVVTGTILAFVEGKPREVDKKKASIDPLIWNNGGGLVLSGSF
jgi:hypothetical protein